MCVSSKIFSRTTASEMPIITQKLVYIMNILNCEIRDPLTKTGAPGGAQRTPKFSIDIYREYFN